MKKIAILGTGAWGTTLANLLLKNKHQVYMWGIDQHEIKQLKTGVNRKYFPNKKLIKAPNLVTNDINQVLKMKPEYIILAVPSIHLISTLQSFINKIDFKPIIINVAKGLNPKNSAV
jgi:glycerol-3-phosphate dehydrogenase (NAD(P)+)